MSDSISENRGLQIFSYEDHEVRTVFIDGEPWWVSSDVCDVLGIDRTQIRRLDDDEKGVHLIHTPGGSQQMAIVNEPGLYTLILRSRKPEAKKFKRWITHEVIPSIRKTGSYTAPSNQPKVELFPMQGILYDRTQKNWRRVPDGYFGILPELYTIMMKLTYDGYDVPTIAKPDISVGTRWKAYALEHYGIEPSGQYGSLDDKDIPRPSYYYPMEYLQRFRVWLEDIFFVEHFPIYRKGAIERQAKKDQQLLEGPNKKRRQSHLPKGK